VSDSPCIRHSCEKFATQNENLQPPRGEEVSILISGVILRTADLGDASCLMSCHLRFVSNSCHFLSRRGITVEGTGANEPEDVDAGIGVPSEGWSGEHDLHRCRPIAVMRVPMNPCSPTISAVPRRRRPGREGQHGDTPESIRVFGDLAGQVSFTRWHKSTASDA
jgi:hypothetical protein